MKKTSDKDSYKVGGQGQYTITVTNDRKGTVAKNVVIKDALKTTGTVIDEKSIKLLVQRKRNQKSYRSKDKD